jgi:hypothetical protein
MTQQTNDLFLLLNGLRNWSNGLGLAKNTCGDQPLTEEILAGLEAELRDLAALFSSAIAGQRMQEITAVSDKLALASKALGWEQLRAERARRRAEKLGPWSGVKPGNTVIVKRHHESIEPGKPGTKLVIANDTAASFVGITRDGKRITVILSGGCRATFRPSKVATLDSYKAGATRFSLIDLKHADEVQRSEHAAHAIFVSQQIGWSL